MRRRGVLLFAVLLLIGCSGTPLPSPSFTTRPALIPGQVTLTELLLADQELSARFAPAAEGAAPLRYELRCRTASDTLTLHADADAASADSMSEQVLRFALLPTDPDPFACTLTAWATRGYGPDSAERPVSRAPVASESPPPSASPLPVATVFFSAALPLPAFDPIACAALTEPPTLSAREPSTGTPLMVARAPGRFTTARLRDGSLLLAPDPLLSIVPPLTTPSLRLRAGSPLELRSSGGLSGATVELYDASVLSEGTLLLDPLVRRFLTNGPGSVSIVANPLALSATMTLRLDPTLPTGRYLLVVSGTAYTPCAAYSPERSLLLIDAIGGFAPPLPTPTVLPTTTP